MRYTHVLFLLALVGWPGHGPTRALAQDTAPPTSLLPFEATAQPGAPPTPQLARMAVELGAGGLTFRVLYDPAWAALFRPQVRVGQVRAQPVTDEGIAPRLEGEAEAIQQALEQALERAQPPAAPSP